MTPKQKDLLVFLATYRDQAIPWHFRDATRWAKTKGYIANTGRTTGIANTNGGPQWIYHLTDAGRTALEDDVECPE